MEQYSTQKPQIILREYGRNVQMIARQIQATEDKDQRTRMAYTLVELMKQINPALRDNQDYNQKIWDDLCIICGFDLDVEMPVARPDKSIREKRPDTVHYNTNNLRYRHYGRNVELLVERAINAKDAEEKEAATIFLGKLMKRFFNTWNNDTPEDEMIIKNIEELSGGQLTLDREKVKNEDLLRTSYKDNSSQTASERNDRGHSNHRGGGHHQNKRRGGGGGKRNGGGRNHGHSGGGRRR